MREEMDAMWWTLSECAEKEETHDVDIVGVDVEGTIRRPRHLAIRDTKHQAEDKKRH